MKICVVLLASCFSFSALALDKQSLEERGEILVWDYGTIAGEVDRGDGLTDLTRPCAKDVRPESLTLKPVKTFSRVTARSPEKNRQLRRLLLQAHLTDFPFNSNIVSLRATDNLTAHSPLFLIFPEHHLEYDRSLRSLLVHHSRTDEILRMAKHLVAANRRVFNAVEGPRGHWRSRLKGVERKNLSAWSLVHLHFLSGGDALAEIGLVPTAFVDEPGINLQWAVADLARAIRDERGYEPSRNYFSRVRDWFIKAGLTHLIGKYSIESFFNKLIVHSPSEIAAREVELCEQRSAKMVDNALLESSEQKVDVIFLSAGALHVHGIRERLQQLELSYLVFSPNVGLLHDDR